MSSRLLGMKFMQRAAASSEKDAAEPAAKRQRLSAPAADAPVKNVHWGNGSETKWRLNVRDLPVRNCEPPLRVVPAGFTVLDGEVEDAEDEDGPGRSKMEGRKSYGKFNKSVERQQNADATSLESEESFDEDEGEIDPSSDKNKAPFTVDLDKLTSISANGKPSLANVVCHKCGGRGHLQRNCPDKDSKKRKPKS
ncbi:hypothetical protein K470DRAFT_264998 [Piedraia hortae CBS 480.64]|uniref:CCHC-type domain-containing protein n=1 Tax=Piedraia hortae CBS 480.64 TaxID=1314780 RepID=A0A6A7BYE0_9PEZI|nr:hypothetical protein K470DRAFT_264998 [Piedraia hortae CBS 480.64]